MQAYQMVAKGDWVKSSFAKLLLITGKGGIGKSLLSAALGRLLASQGKSVLVVELAHKPSILGLYGLLPMESLADDLSTHAKPLIQKDIAVTKGLSVACLDPRRCFEEYVIKQLNKPLLYETVFKRKVVATFFETVPGLSELMLLGRLFYSAQVKAPPYDHVIFDAQASGHFLHMLTTPQSIMNMGLTGPLVNEVKRIVAFLGDPKLTETIFVSEPEPLIASELMEFVPKIPSCQTLVINRATFHDIVFDQRDEDLDYLQTKISSRQAAFQSIIDFAKVQHKRVVVLDELKDIPLLVTDQFSQLFFS